MAPIEIENTSEAIRRNTRAYNAILERIILRRPEQWYWVHRRLESGCAQGPDGEAQAMTGAPLTRVNASGRSRPGATAMS